ncbi:MAG: peptidoglycan DD-metalloendopeptidase family protein [Campylobacterota bacterium]|nr:peptidoglycan DD-metalloendopeptidase family protein [Campylobacterota bacterium]
MLKNLLILALSFISLTASIADLEKKIGLNKQIYDQSRKNRKSLNKDINNLANRINKEEKTYNDIVSKLDKINTRIFLNRIKLDNAKTQLKILKSKAKILKEKKENIEKDVIDFVIERYSMTLGLGQIKKESFKELIDKEVYSLVLENSKQEVLDLNIDYLKVNRQTRQNIDKSKELTKYIKKQEDVKKEFLSMQKEQKIAISSLKVQHKQYQDNLKTIISKQNKLTDLLGDLDILKNKEIKKQRAAEKKRKAKLAREKARKAKARKAKEKKEKAKQQQAKKQTAKAIETKQMKILSRKELDDDIDIEVRNIGSSTKGVKISKYNGRKTMAPLKSYTITKRFGKYYDKVYKIELFNESVSLKTKVPNAKVYNVFKGQIVYAKQDSGLLENVVIVKHSGGLHTIYSHLDKISPTLKVGKWIPKGYVVGRVNDTLLFQATKNSKYIDPVKLFK